MTIAWAERPKTVLLTGNSEFLKEQEIRRAIAALPDHRVLEFVGTDIDDAVTALTSRSLFSSKKVVVIRSIGKAKSRRNILVDYCSDPSEDIVLIMASQHRKRLHKWLTSDLKTEVREKFDEPPSWKLPEWVLEEAKARDLDFPKNFAEAIVMNVGEDLYSLTNELDKLKVYCGDRSAVEVADIEAVLFQHTAVSPFEVVDLWAMGERAASVRMFLTHLDKTPKTEWMRSILVIMVSLQDRVEALLKAKALKQARKSSSEIAKSLGVSPYVYMNSLSDQVKKRNAVKLEDAYIRLCEIEAEVKIGGPGKLHLESFLLTF